MLSELRSNQAKQQIRTPIELSGPLYGAVRGWVSHEALRKVEEQRKLLYTKTPPPPLICTGVFTKSWGLPCVHTIKSLIESHGVLLLEHFHTHWHLRRKGSPQHLLEPLQRTDMVNHISRAPQQSTRREPSLFETIEPTRAPPTCSRCHQTGHTKAGNNCPLRHAELLQRLAAHADPLGNEMSEMDAAPGDNTDEVFSSLDLAPTEAELRRGVETYPVPFLPTETQASAESRRSNEPTSEVNFPLPVSEPDFTEDVEELRVLEARESSLSPGGAITSPGLCPEDTAHSSPPIPEESTIQTPRYDSPAAIYARYIAAREAWYAAQPKGSIKTNQMYRKASGLPLRYDKQSYAWCLDYKQMSSRCASPSGMREWTKEEMMAYLDWSKQEDDRIEAKVAAEIRDDPAAWKRRGVKHVWRSIEKGMAEQKALYSLKGQEEVEDCIVVK
ncbi:hypothetical protein MAN_10610, partial [Metarhizium hybridum]